MATPDPGGASFDGAWLSAPNVSRHGISFWLLRTPVTVRYSFFLVGALLAQQRSLGPALVWIATAAIAVLIHEMGHALTARHYGQRPRVDLHGMGGVTTWSWLRPIAWHQRMLISLAGPGVGFVAGGSVFAAVATGHVPAAYLARVAVSDFLWVTLVWGVLNLLPILPLDGGGAMAEVLRRLDGPDRGLRAARTVSCVAGAAGVALGVALGQVWLALLCGLFAWSNFQQLRGQGMGTLPA